MGPQPKYVNAQASHLNRILIEPPTPGALRKRAEARREVSQPKRKMRRNVSIGERGVITWGADIQAAILADPDRADRLYREVATAVGQEFDLEVLGLVVHADESAPHAHVLLDSFDSNGHPVASRIARSGSRIQDVAAEAAQRVMPSVERGKRKTARIEAGEDPAKLRRRSVREMHVDLTGRPDPSATDVAEAVQRLRDAEAAAAEAEQRAEEAEAREEAAETATAEIETRWTPKLAGLAGPGRQDLAQRDAALEASLREIEAGTCAPAEPVGKWEIRDKPRWDEIGHTLHPGPLGWGSRIWGTLRRVAAVLGGEDLKRARAERDTAQRERDEARRQRDDAAARRDAAQAAAATSANRERKFAVQVGDLALREAAAAAALEAIAAGRTAPGRDEGRWKSGMDPGWWAAENRTLHPGPLGWGETLWAALRTAGQALVQTRAERDARLTPAAEAELRQSNAHRLLILAARCDSQALVDQALEEGADLDRPADDDKSDLTSFTALHMAMAWASPAMVQRLLDDGADPSVTTSNGLTPAALARDLLRNDDLPASTSARLEEILQLLDPPPPPSPKADSGPDYRSPGEIRPEDSWTPRPPGM